MALIGSGTPLLYVEGVATNISGSGTQRTVKITAKFKVNGSSASWYGYACNWRARVNNSYGSWTAIKGTESWNGGQALRTFEQTLTVDVGTTSSTNITVGIYTDSQIDSGWDGSYTWTHTVGSTNVAPTISGTVTTSPSGTIAENTSSITVTSPTASDANGNLSGYRCRVSVNGGGYTEIYRGSSRSCTHNVSSYGEGTTFKYCFDAYDSAGAWSNNVYSAVVTKNKFTNDTLASSSNISYNSSSISFTYSGASNTNGNTTFTRSLSCDGLTVYNSAISATPVTVTIYKSGTVPTTPYIKFDDIKNKFKGAAYKGTLTFTLTTTNAYGTKKTSSKALSVNLQTAPNAVGSCSIATDTNSTAYITVKTGDGSTSSKYFIPDSGRVIRVNWTAGSGKLGEAVVYDLYAAYGSGAWQLIASNLTTLSYNHSVPKQSISQQIKYRIRTKCSYNNALYIDKDTAAQTLHYYSGVGITVGAITREATKVSVNITVKSNTSLSNVNTVGSAILYNKGTTTQVGSTATLSQSQAAQTISFTGLTEGGSYDLKVTYNDITGLTSANQTHTISVGPLLPVFDINKYGIGANGAKADSNYSIKANGGLEINRNGDGATLLHFNTDRGWSFKQGGTGSGASLDLIADTSDKIFRIMPPSKNKSINFSVSDASASQITVDGNKVYHAGSKPTPSEIGAMADGGTYGTLYLNNWIRTKGNTGLYFQDYGGGWYMSDTTWIRSWGSKQVYINSLLRADGGLQAGTNGANFTVSTAGNVTCAGDINAGGSLRLSSSPSNYSRLGYDTSTGDTYVANGANNWLRLKTDKSMTYAGYQVYTNLNKGNIPIDYTRISNLNSRLASGWYSWSSGTTGAPTTYGVLLQIQWTSSGDFYQIAVGSNNALYTRAYVNGAYTAWSTK